MGATIPLDSAVLMLWHPAQQQSAGAGAHPSPEQSCWPYKQGVSCRQTSVTACRQHSLHRAVVG